MTPVGGSRHYDGGGLGQVGIWGCPSCGEDNTGPITQGCTACGAGRPGVKAGEPPPPPRVSEREPDDPTYHEPQPVPRDEVDRDLAISWAKRHPDGTLDQAFIAGYIEGVRAARKAQLAAHPPEPIFPPAGKQARTLIAALELFRDQVLTKDHDAVESGEWCSPAEVTTLIHQLQHEVESYA